MPSGFEIAEQRIRDCDGVRLDLRGLGLTKIPESIKDLVNLKWLFIRYNKTTKLPNALQKRVISGDLYEEFKQKG